MDSKSKQERLAVKYFEGSASRRAPRPCRHARKGFPQPRGTLPRRAALAGYPHGRSRRKAFSLQTHLPAGFRRKTAQPGPQGTEDAEDPFRRSRARPGSAVLRPDSCTPAQQYPGTGYRLHQGRPGRRSNAAGRHESNPARKHHP